jgi:GTP-binding protein
MREKDAIEFFTGLGEYFTFASISGSGTGIYWMHLLMLSQ